MNNKIYSDSHNLKLKKYIKNKKHQKQNLNFTPLKTPKPTKKVKSRYLVTKEEIIIPSPKPKTPIKSTIKGNNKIVPFKERGAPFDKKYK